MVLPGRVMTRLSENLGYLLEYSRPSEADLAPAKFSPKKKDVVSFLLLHATYAQSLSIFNFHCIIFEVSVLWSQCLSLNQFSSYVAGPRDRRNFHGGGGAGTFTATIEEYQDVEFDTDFDRIVREDS